MIQAQRPINHLDSPNTILKVFLTKRYCDVMSDEDIEDINSKQVLLYLIYKGTCVKAILYIHNIQKQQVS